MARIPGLRPPSDEYQLVRYRPWQRVLALVLAPVVVVVAVAVGYWLGSGFSALDRAYLASLEVRDHANTAELSRLRRELVDAQLGQSVDGQAARSLRDTVSELRNEVAGLREEVVFYKSLMAPSSVQSGLQIAEFELSRGRRKDQFTYHILLTQIVHTRRDWVAGHVAVEVRGQRATSDGPVEEVLALTELQQLEQYPLPFRFRYFQDLAGRITLPPGFDPQAVVVTVTPSARGSDSSQRSFGWALTAG